MTRAYVYKHINIETNEFYIGYRYSKVRFDNNPYIDLYHYICSSPTVKTKILINREKWISMIIQEFENPIDAYYLEQYLIKINWGNNLMLNKQYRLGKTKCFMKSGPFSKEHKEKISKSLKNYTKSDSHRKALSEANKGKVIPEATRNKISAANTGKKRTEDTCAKIANSLKGHQVSDVTRTKISLANSGRPQPKGKNNPCSKSIICVTTNEVFGSQPEAAQAYNLRQSDINNVLKGRQKTVKGLVFKYHNR